MKNIRVEFIFIFIFIFFFTTVFPFSFSSVLVSFVCMEAVTTFDISASNSYDADTVKQFQATSIVFSCLYIIALIGSIVGVPIVRKGRDCLDIGIMYSIPFSIALCRLW